MGVLCYWLVSLAPIIAKASRNVAGKVLLIWLPLATFFSVGFGHAVVNMFVFPLALIVNPDITLFDWWVWNQIPVAIGNIIGAVVFNSMLWYKSHSTGSGL